MRHYLVLRTTDKICVSGNPGSLSIVVDVETSDRELTAVLGIRPLCYLLMTLERPEERLAFIEDMHRLQELRKEYFESAAWSETPREMVTRRLTELSTKWAMNYREE